MADKKKKSLAYPIIFVLILAAIMTFALAFLNQATQPIVQANQEEELMRKVLYVFDIDTSGMDIENLNQYFDENIQRQGDEEREIFALVENGEKTAYALPVFGPGLWGGIDAYVGVDKEFNETIGLEFIAQEETPGLGGRIAEDWYKDQFRGIEIDKDSPGPYVINNPAPGGNIDAIAGATQTSQFVVDMVNDGLEHYIQEGVE